MYKRIIGVLLILIGVSLGLYVGVWLMFIGGIVQVIEQVKAPQLEAIQVAYGIARVVFAGFAGWLAAVIFIIPGWLLATK